jgi:hypothetical protein
MLPSGHRQTGRAHFPSGKDKMRQFSLGSTDRKTWNVEYDFIFLQPEK